MASAVTTQTIRSKYKFQFWDHDPGATTAILVSPDGGTTVRSVDMRDYDSFAVAAVATIFGAASGITKLEIVAADDSALSTNVVVVKDSGTVDADAIGDWLMEECTAEEVAQLSAENGYASRYVGGRITCSNAGDEAVVCYFGVPKREYLNLTPATTIA